MDKKQGNIHFYTDFRDLNKTCPNYNYSTSFIDQIIDACAGSNVFSFMDGFSIYNKIQIKPKDQHKTTFIFPLRTFTYKNIPFELNNTGSTFQREMSFSFYDIKHIVEPYLNDLPTHS